METFAERDELWLVSVDERLWPLRWGR